MPESFFEHWLDRPWVQLELPFTGRWLKPSERAKAQGMRKRIFECLDEILNQPVTSDRSQA